MKYYSIFLAGIFFCACSQKKDLPDTLTAQKGFDLEKISFNEKPVTLLNTAIDSAANAQIEYAEKGYSEVFDYPVGYKLEPWNGDHSFYGKAYYSKTSDSIARYRNLYFDRMAFLTHEGKTVAVLAQADVLSESVYLDFVKLLNTQFGSPVFEPQTNVDVFYEWNAGDRYLQTDYYKGAAVTAGSNEPMKVEEIFTIQFLIFNREAADEIKKIQESNYSKTQNYRVMPGDFQLYSQDPMKNLLMMNELLDKKFN